MKVAALTSKVVGNEAVRETPPAWGMSSIYITFDLQAQTTSRLCAIHTTKSFTVLVEEQLILFVTQSNNMPANEIWFHFSKMQRHHNYVRGCERRKW